MDRSRFEHLMGKARTFQSLGDRPDYWTGYQRGLRRRFHGEAFGTPAEHQTWLALGDDPTRKELGKGYRDGLNEGSDMRDTACITESKRHSWTRRGGCKENPGVWGIGGAAIQITEVCEVCEVTRTKIIGDVDHPTRNHKWEYRRGGTE